MGISKHQEIIMRYELKEYEDFFYILWEVCNGVIKRQHIRVLYPKTFETRIKDWKEAGLIKERSYGGNYIYELRYTVRMCLLRQQELSGDKLLRSILRMEYFFSIGLKTPSDIRNYIEKGNNRVNRKGLPLSLLSSYDKALRERGIYLYKLDSKDNADSLYNLTLHNVFIDKVKVKDGAIIPYVVLLSFRENYPSEICREALIAYHGMEDLFFDYANQIEIRPHITICRFEGESKPESIYKYLLQQPEFSIWDMDCIKDTFNVLELPKPFHYLKPSRVV